MFEAVFDPGGGQIERAACDDGKRTERSAGRNVGGRGSRTKARRAFDEPVPALGGRALFLGKPQSG